MASSTGAVAADSSNIRLMVERLAEGILVTRKTSSTLAVDFGAQSFDESDCHDVLEKVADCHPYETSPDKTHDEDVESSKLRVEGIPLIWTAVDLFHHFRHLGQIISCRILLDPATGTSKGTAYVRFRTPAQARLAASQLKEEVLAEEPGKETTCLANVKFDWMKETENASTQSTSGCELPTSEPTPSSTNSTLSSVKIQQQPENPISDMVYYGWNPILWSSETTGKTKRAKLKRRSAIIKPTETTSTPFLSEPWRSTKSSVWGIACPTSPCSFEMDSLWSENGGLAAPESFFHGTFQPFTEITADITHSAVPPPPPPRCFRTWPLVIGNITPAYDEKFLRELFGKYGTVASVNIIERGSAIGNGYAFVDMFNAQEAFAAVEMLNNFEPAPWHRLVVSVRPSKGPLPIQPPGA